MSKKKFLNFGALKNYITSSKKRHLTFYIRISNKYPGIVETLSLFSDESGKKLTLINDFDCFGLDWMGDLSRTF